VAVSRWPGERIAVRFSRVYAPDGKILDFDLIERDILDFCRNHAVVLFVYDRFLMGQMVRRLTGKLPCSMEPFSQAGDRLEADRALKDAILARLVPHDGSHSDLRQHLDNANAKSSADGRQLRIVKRGTRKIDAAVTLSMAHARAGAVLPRALPTKRPERVPNRFKEGL
jgi:phage terminase large subunit-like protein